jgi:hypothetical protein
MKAVLIIIESIDLLRGFCISFGNKRGCYASGKLKSLGIYKSVVNFAQKQPHRFVEKHILSKPKKLCKKALTKGRKSGRILKLSRDRVLQKKRRVRDLKESGARGSDLRQTLRAVKRVLKKIQKTFEKPLDKSNRM